MKNTIIASSLVALMAIVGGYAISQRHVSASTASQSQAIVSSAPEATTATDTDNIQDESGAQDQQDVHQATDTETNDDATEAVGQKAGQDVPENSNDAPDAQ